MTTWGNLQGNELRKKIQKYKNTRREVKNNLWQHEGIHRELSQVGEQGGEAFVGETGQGRSGEMSPVTMMMLIVNRGNPFLDAVSSLAPTPAWVKQNSHILEPEGGGLWMVS